MPTMTNPETGETKEISMEEFMEAMQGGSISVRQEVHHADGSVTSSMIFGNDTMDGIDRSVNIFGSMEDVLKPVLASAQRIKEANENADQLFFMDNTGADYEVTVDDTLLPIMHIVTCKKDSVHIGRYIRDERKSVGKPMAESTYTFIDGKISATLEDVQGGKELLLFAFGVYEIRKILKERGLLQELKKIDNRGSGVIITSTDDQCVTRIVRGKNRPELPCLLFGGLFAQSMEDAVLMRPYMDEIMGDTIRTGMSVEQMISEAENGDPDCMEMLAQAYLNGDDKVSQDFKKSAYWWENLANTGNAIGQFNIGLFYAKGCGVKRDFAKAAEWMRKSAENGDEDASAVAEMYAGAAENLKRAESGDAVAQAEIAKLYTQIGGSLDQFGTQHDYEESFKWAKKAADQGNADGMYCLALCYEHGRGVSIAKNKAADIYEKAANMGHAPSQWNLAVCYLNGSGRERDEVKGYMWAYQSADQGYELAIDGLSYQEKSLEQVIDFFSSPESDETLTNTQYDGRADRCEALRPGTELTHKITRDKNNTEIIELFYRGGSVGELPKWGWSSSILLALLKLDRIKLVIKVKSCIPKSKRGARARSAEVLVNFIIEEKKPETPEERAARLKAEEEAGQKTEEEVRHRAEEKRRREEEARRIAEEARRIAEAEAKAKYEEELQEYYEAHKKWEGECTEINVRRSAFVDSKIAGEKVAIESAAKQERDRIVSGASTTIAEQKKRKAEAEAILTALGVFKFGEKKAQKAAIEDATQKIVNAQGAIGTAEADYNRKLNSAETTAKAKEQAFRTEAVRAFPLPVEPKKPVLQQKTTTPAAPSPGVTSSPHASQSNYTNSCSYSDKEMKDAILSLLASEPYRQFTIAEILDECGVLSADFTPQKISALLRQLRSDGLVSATYEQRKAFFQIL